MSIEAEFENQIEVSRWIDKNLAVKYEFSNEKERWSFSCFDMVVEHHSAVLTLTQSKLHGAAFALLRVEFEAFVRGMWLLYVAVEADISRFKRDKIDPQFHELIEAVESARGIKSGILSYIKEQQWSIFNSFTHTGIEALLRRIGPDTTGYNNYSDTDVINSLRISGLIVLFAACELAILSGENELIDGTVKLLNEYRDK